MSFDQLWAGWRSSYVTTFTTPEGTNAAGEAVPDDEAHCIFCQIIASNAPDIDRHVIAEDESVVTMLNAYPYASGHLLVMPRRHVRHPSELDGAESATLWAHAIEALGAIERAYAPDGANLGVNLGRAAGAGIPRHLHLHLVPRWVGDTNFTTAIASVRVMPESLGDSFARLKDAWRAQVDLVALCDAASEEAARLVDLVALPGAVTKGAAGYQRDARDALVACRVATRPKDSSEPEAARADVRGLEELAEELSGAVLGAVVEGTATEEELEEAVLRCALRVAIARVELAEQLGRPGAIERELAIEGVRLRLAALSVRDAPLIDRGDRHGLGGSLALVASDEPLAFLVEVQRGRLRYRERRGPADVVVVGSASGLCRFLFGRGIGRDLEVTGNRGIAERLGTLAPDRD